MSKVDDLATACREYLALYEEMNSKPSPHSDYWVQPFCAAEDKLQKALDALRPDSAKSR